MALKCENCGGPVISRGELVCSKCGLVMGPEMDDSPAFFDEGRSTPTTSYYPPNRNTGELGSLVGRGYPKWRYSEGQNDTLNKIRWGERIDHRSRNRGLGFYREVSSAHSLLGLPNHIKEEVLYYYKRVRGKLALAGYSCEDTVAGFYLFVCRLRKHPITPETIYRRLYPHLYADDGATDEERRAKEKAIRRVKKTVKRICYRLARHLHTPLSTSPLDQLSLPSTSSMPPALIDRARKNLEGWLNNERMRRVISGDSPASWAAAAVAVAGGDTISAEEAGGAFGVRPSRVRKKLALIRKEMEPVVGGAGDGK